jgi:hypothetical protein
MNFNARPFFSLFFFIARANQKIPNLALGRHSTKTATNEINSEIKYYSEPRLKSRAEEAQTRFRLRDSRTGHPLLSDPVKLP